MNRLQFLKTIALAPFAASAAIESKAETITSSCCMSNGSDRLIICKTGNVGIGVTSTSYMFEVNRGDGTGYGITSDYEFVNLEYDYF